MRPLSAAGSRDSFAQMDAVGGHLLVVEDYEPLREALVRGLSRLGLAVRECGDGATALDAALSDPPRLVVLDLMLPGLDGFEFLRRLRHAGSRAKVLILTARDALEDRVQGLDLGGDDYLVKPFAFEELTARVRALLRRDAAPETLVVEDLEVRLSERRALRNQRELDLTAREFSLLACLARREGGPVAREEIFEEVFPKGAAAQSNVVVVCILALRRKLEEGGETRILHTRRGFGYQLGGRA